MAALANSHLDIGRIEKPNALAPREALAKLAALHREAADTARLANIVGRSLPVAIAMPIAAAAVALAAAQALAPALAWCALVGIAAAALARCYARALQQPFERAALQAFASDLDACLLFSGAAWGAGALLVLPPLASGVIALAFVVLPCLAIAMILRASRPVLYFLAPAAALTALACVMRPFSDGWLAAALVLAGCAILGAAMHIGARRADDDLSNSLPAGLPDTE
jgi:hypothetical protein